jgi:predicted ABC-type ATPase
MSKRLIILAPSAGGKSTLMRYLRDNTNLPIFEMDEEIMSANHNEWPSDNQYKDDVLVPKIVQAIIEKPEAIYLASYIPEDLLETARAKGFRIVLINISLHELMNRNKKRMDKEKYADSTPWLQLQLDSFDSIVEKGLIDTQIDGHQDTETIADEIIAITN